MDRWIINGTPGHSISVMDRGFTYADGLFETIAVRDGGARFVDYHLQRLLDSCVRLSIPVPGDEILRAEIDELASGCERGTIKIIVTRGAGTRGYAPPEKPESTRIVGLVPDEAPSDQFWKSGIAIRFCRTRIGIDPDLAGMKTLGRLDQVIARSELIDSVFHEGLMSTEDGQVICGTMSNLFQVKDGKLTTPGLARCGISGVMRRLVMERALSAGIECHQAVLERQDLLGASEIFVTNSRIGIWPVVRLESAQFEIGPTTRLLMAALAEIGVAECDG